MSRSFENRRRILLAQMLPHTCIGHPVASFLSFVGLDQAAGDFHYFTLPARTKRRLKRADVQWNSDSRLRPVDCLVIPVCAVLRACGLYRFANSVFRIGPHELATELGACGYYYGFYDEARGPVERCQYCGKKIKLARGAWIDPASSGYCSNNPNDYSHTPKG